jgi:hypothetical protein
MLIRTVCREMQATTSFQAIEYELDRCTAADHLGRASSTSCRAAQPDQAEGEDETNRTTQSFHGGHYMGCRARRSPTELASLNPSILGQPHLVHTHVHSRSKHSWRDLLDRVCLSNG